jgi:23S rRNA (adenine1618-N6)-methyltransferase
MHYMADVLAASNQGKIPKGSGMRGLDIGTGASCIYPILAHSIYGWSFVGSEIDADALKAAQKNVSANPNLEANIQVRKQKKNKGAFEGIIQENEYFDLTVCNPPFHASAADAEAGTRRKARNLGGPKSDKPVLNFGGKSNELWCEGGEVRFVSDMVRQSKTYGTSCFWYSSLLSKETSILPVTKVIQKAGAAEFRVIPMGQGSKSSRIVVWTFLSPKQQKIWAKTRW